MRELRQTDAVALIEYASVLLRRAEAARARTAAFVARSLELQQRSRALLGQR